MKKLLLSFSLCMFLVSGSVFAQKANFSLGVKGGVNMNKVDGKSFKDEFTYGYQAGLFSELNFHKNFGIQPEILWSETVYKTTNQLNTIYPNANTIKDIKLNYLTIPVLLNIRPSSFFTFQAGPQFGLLVNKDKDLLSNSKDAFKTGDLSLLAGVQLKLAMFRIYGRYVVGLNSVNDIDDKDEWKNQSIQLGVGISFF